MKPYLYLNGLKKLASEIDGNEVVHMGIRPYGFHAGNALALIVYPYLLCRYLEMGHKVPKLRFVVSLNDWEQDALDGPDFRKYPFNIYPKNTSLQFTPDEEGCCASIVDHWEPKIKGTILKIRHRFHDISFEFVRNSSLINQQSFKKLLLETITRPRDQMAIFKRFSAHEVLNKPIQYAGVICPKCERAQGQTRVTRNDLVWWRCHHCGENKRTSYDNLCYWWFHKPMLLARLEIFGIDITLSGGDHFSEGDFLIRRALMARYAPNIKELKMLFTPTVVALNGEKMSKSRGNTSFVDIKKFIKTMDGFTDGAFTITKELILDQADEHDYSDVF